MGRFKRFCLAVFAIAGLLCLLALWMPWVGPYTRGATALMTQTFYFRAVEALSGITILGLLVCLIRAIVSRRVDSILVTGDGGSQVTVTRAAIASQAIHIIEEDGTCYPDRVDVRAKRKGTVDLNIKLRPYVTVDVLKKGPQIYQDLLDGLSALCGDHVDTIDIEFLEAERAERVDAAEQQNVEATSEVTYNPADFAARLDGAQAQAPQLAAAGEDATDQSAQEV